MTAPDQAAEPAARLAEFLAGLSAQERSLFDAEREQAQACLSAPGGAERVLAAARSAFTLANEPRKLELLQAAPALACHEGCHWCCYLKVSVTAPEALVLAAHLEQYASPAELERVKARAAAFARDPRIFSADAKAAAKMPCPVLTDSGACGAYEARPIACRAWNSADAEACHRWLDDDSALPPADERLSREVTAVGLGLLRAVQGAGLRGELLELTAALDISLREPRALERWLAGESVFEAARITES
jgi:hypothetical protein